MHLALTTPKGALVDTEVDEVIAPGVLGEFGILPGHIPFLSALRPGVLVCRAKDSVRVFAVGEGVLEVARVAGEGGGDKVLVLVDQAVTAEEVDRDASTREVTAADQELGAWKKELGGEYRALVTRRDWAQARIEAAARRAPH
jgi:F-type H+-transporting ATPase subunit epsilon